MCDIIDDILRLSSSERRKVIAIVGAIELRSMHAPKKEESA